MFPLKVFDNSKNLLKIVKNQNYACCDNYIISFIVFGKNLNIVQYNGAKENFALDTEIDEKNCLFIPLSNEKVIFLNLQNCIGHAACIKSGTVSQFPIMIIDYFDKENLEYVHPVFHKIQEDNDSVIIHGFKYGCHSKSKMEIIVKLIESIPVIVHLKIISVYYIDANLCYDIPFYRSKSDFYWESIQNIWGQINAKELYKKQIFSK